MPRNLVVCCDGTNNQFGPENTNVVRLVQVIQHSPQTQLVYYDPGVGTFPEPGAWTRIGKRLSEWIDLAFATDLSRRVQQAYVYLMNYWQPGDQTYLVGFSRGAYTVRVLAALLYHLGLLPRGSENMVPYAMRLFSGTRTDTDDDSRTGNYWQLCNEFRRTFARPIHGNDQRHFPTHFLGAWDTVSSVGWVWNPKSYPYTRFNPGIAHARHAMALDERRCFFRQNHLTKKDGATQDLMQGYFPGVHSDVGGGYNNSRLWQCPFDWLLDEARNLGLDIDTTRRNALQQHASAQSWTEKQHESLTLRWWIAEFIPKKVYNDKTEKRTWRLGLGRHRTINDGELLHESVLRRITDTAYAPTNLSARFIANVRALAATPPWLPYEQ